MFPRSVTAALWTQLRPKRCRLLFSRLYILDNAKIISRTINVHRYSPPKYEAASKDPLRAAHTRSLQQGLALSKQKAEHSPCSDLRLISILETEGTADMEQIFSGSIDFLDDNTTDPNNTEDFLDLLGPCFTQENNDFNRIFLPTVYSFIFLLGIIGNGLVVLVMGYQKKSRTMTDKYRLHLSVADLLFVFTLPFWSVDAAIGWYFKEFFVSDIEGTYVCDRIYPVQNREIWTVGFRFLHITVGLILPGLIILTCYCVIISKLSHSKGHQKRKALKTTVILILAFFACWLPYYICLTIDTFGLLGLLKFDCYIDNMLHKWISITEALAFFHCCLNPILYAFLGAKFKTSAQNAFTSVSRGSSLKILSKKRAGLSSVSTESESSSFHSS
ncbi:unnamed protein product [Ranitomeya imitator]|uniref:G-protein coupled receptors family 1 profile domain-containing protein n=1 Tax=Ranitomeya imitator TaxID=111125 RepID=A0ABN9LIJ5_9NEOB|nr:unnamed protein product [Ranitomeya imitator]